MATRSLRVALHAGGETAVARARRNDDVLYAVGLEHGQNDLRCLIIRIHSCTSSISDLLGNDGYAQHIVPALLFRIFHFKHRDAEQGHLLLVPFLHHLAHTTYAIAVQGHLVALHAGFLRLGAHTLHIAALEWRRAMFRLSLNHEGDVYLSDNSISLNDI